jgi:lysophospholipase L1-like esterase
VLRFGAVDDKWFPAFDGYRAAARRVSDAAGAIFVPFQTMFDEAAKISPPERWARDGVHPTSDGAALMAHTWMKTVGV